MFIQKLTKSYSNSLPVYEPIPSDAPAHDHETGSFSCTYSPQHSVGVARVIVQSAEIRRPQGWKRWFSLKPASWVKVKVLGRTKGGVEGRGMGEIKTWREERAVGETEVSPRTYTPNFGFKSYYTLVGPYENRLELEIRNKRHWLWPFTRDSFMGSTNFVLPHSYPQTSPTIPTVVVSYHEPSPSSQEPLELVESRPSSVVSGLSTVHEGVEHPQQQPEKNEWAVQAALFNREMSRIEGYLLYNVLWYPALPVNSPLPTYIPPEEREEGDGTHDTLLAGIVTFTVHSIDQLDTAPDREASVTVSLGWHRSPLHTARMIGTESSSLSRTPSTVDNARPQGGISRTISNRYPVEVDQEKGGASTTAARFDSTFEFLCFDPTTTNIVLKVFEGRSGGRKKEIVAHTSVPLRDLVGPAASEEGGVGMQGETVHKRLSGGDVGRDRTLALLEHPTAKARVCVEWRGLKIPEVHTPITKHA
ncbi:hypothetical protein D9611_003083 [Ephemerocybe angulata]|uniref:C2 domain-containing protein n=1 Tax=Ephemerocybe angulata TaxID=980116 RepID=A0A8H5C9I4_9AGAR|nr:hypothetical protein D9611_003083 [Tulosesus angulatus]